MYISILLFLEIYTYNLKQTHPYIMHIRWTLRYSSVYISIWLNCIFNLWHTIRDNLLHWWVRLSWDRNSSSLSLWHFWYCMTPFISESPFLLLLQIPFVITFISLVNWRGYRDLHTLFWQSSGMLVSGLFGRKETTGFLSRRLWIWIV